MPPFQAAYAVPGHLVIASTRHRIRRSARSSRISCASLPKAGDVTLGVYDAVGNRVRELTANKKRGMHRVTWDLRTAPPYTARRPANQAGEQPFRQRDPSGPFVLPGRYTARLSVKSGSGSPAVYEAPIDVRSDPLVQMSEADYHALYDMRVSTGH